MEVVGIDFGTTNVRISTWDSESAGLPQPQRIGKGNSEYMEMMPAIIALQRHSDGSVDIKVGEDALDLEGEENTLVIRHIKRWALSQDPYMRWQMDVNGVDWPTWWNPEVRCVEAWGERFSVKALIAEILKEAINRAGLSVLPAGDGFEWRAGCPVHADLEYRSMLSEILAEFSGGGNLNWVADEPVLVLTAPFRMGVLEPGSYLVYDLGGGSFDCALVEVRPNGEMIVYGADGHPLLGGADIQQDIAETGATFETVVKANKYISRSMMSLRDAYASAKIVWARGPDDWPFGDTIFQDDDTGEVRFVWQTEYTDMTNDLKAIILFGGPTTNPVFFENLGRWFGESKIKGISELVAIDRAEFTALSMGACYFSQQQDSTGNYPHMVPNRLPVHITLENLDNGKSVEYVPHQHFGEIGGGERFNPTHGFFDPYTSPELKQSRGQPR